MFNNGKARSTLLGVVGAYLCYLAYQLFEGRAETGTAMTPAARYVFIAFFAAAGAAIMVYAVILWKRSLKEDEDQARRKDEEDSLK
ncbi:MAG: hypothetical protein IK099_04820 [Clostridia bacterium]|nr:hypothetical protein [Clostridia bacterium]